MPFTNKDPLFESSPSAYVETMKPQIEVTPILTINQVIASLTPEQMAAIRQGVKERLIDAGVYEVEVTQEQLDNLKKPAEFKLSKYREFPDAPKAD